AEGITKIGSGINELGKAGIATAPFLVDFTQRLGSVANTVGLTLPEVMALAATMEELGLSSEVSSTALQGILTRLGSDLEGFAAAAKVPVEDLRRLFNEDSSEALSYFASNLLNNSENLEDF